MADSLKNNTDIVIQQDFVAVQNILERHRSKALREVNNENVLTAWEVGAFVSNRIIPNGWGRSTVKMLSEFLQTHIGKRGFGQSHIYNMVSFYEYYSSTEFSQYLQQYQNISSAKKHSNQWLEKLRLWK